MSYAELLLVAVGLSMDAFAIAVCSGLTMPRITLKKALTVGLYFGAFQAIMPVIGYVLARQFSDEIAAFDHWITFVLLSLIGGKMIMGSMEKEGCSDRNCPDEICTDRNCSRSHMKEVSLSPAQMLPLAFATSVDAMAVGVSFAFLGVNITQAAVYIGITTLLLSMAGVKIGNMFGTRFKSKAEAAGGIILILLGIKILLEHTGFL